MHLNNINKKYKGNSKKEEKMKGLIKILTLSTLLAVMTGFISACDSGGTKTRVDSRYYDNDRYGLDSYGNRVSSNGYVLSDIIGEVNTATHRMEMGLSLYSDRDTDYNQLTSYSGSVTLKGDLDIIDGGYGNCQLPKGLYQVESERAVQMMGSFFPTLNGAVLRAYSLKDRYYELLIQMNPKVTSTGINRIIGFDGIEYSMTFSGAAFITLVDDGRTICTASVMFTSPR